MILFTDLEETILEFIWNHTQTHTMYSNNIEQKNKVADIIQPYFEHHGIAQIDENQCIRNKSKTKLMVFVKTLLHKESS